MLKTQTHPTAYIVQQTHLVHHLDNLLCASSSRWHLFGQPVIITRAARLLNLMSPVCSLHKHLLPGLLLTWLRR
jgi:hypothetical protein